MRLTRGRFVCGLLIASAVLAQQSQFQSSVPTGAVSSAPVALTLRDAIDRGLKANLGLLVSDSASETARGERLRSLSALLPQLNAKAGETVQQISLKTIGFNFQFPGVSIPTV